ncbi:hypothetical protein TREMEDRAFT_69902 [Tremella mesenterica DSM 1558]|uniref:uncharacterized protein n=1 Tax=Tremella mesenterica (strain ATCC 24925 / CBS 8224 / DSM 1558 / NBRC 9311 / NRRL Y-6157 / RJB 2259-6 / UBC 559-6) TaxID=578456 RepID=UPI0003F49553|nr:uncharacterized protein TREMEDRAFT_69902 [Tremella mesenterica DSM 1558]EIW66904.1 hypothetical protein TREMEDRAFT_69902 [Tremella mesenterica DSM 1558]
MGLYPGNRPASGANGFTNQPGLWSGSTFASPANGAYAYGRPGTDQKAAMAFGKDYGYPNVSNIQNVQNGGQNSHPTLAPAQGQGYPRGFPNYGYGYSSQATAQTQGGIGRFSVQTTPGHGENPSGTGAGMVNGTSGIDYMYGSVDNTGGYYGGVQYQTQQTQGQGQYVTSPVRAQAGRGAPTRKMW